MIGIKDQYFNINRILLLAIGLWPYQQSIFTRFQYVLFSAILTSIIIVQLTTFLTLRCTTDLITKVLASASYFGIPIIKYHAFYFNIESMKDLLMQLQHVHKKLKNKNEITIIKKYDYIAKRYTVIITIMGFCIIFTGIIVQIWSNMGLVDVDLSTNVSQTYNFLFAVEYFIDKQKYFYLILLHVNATICLTMIVMVGIGTMLITYVQYICGMFRIARLSKHLMSKVDIMWFCLIMCGVICLSLNLYQITLSENEVGKFLLPFVCVTTCILYMFLANFMGQIIVDHNNHVFTTVYNVQWYRAPLNVQRIVLFLLQKRTKGFTLRVGKIFIASIEFFATLVKASVSYFTVIYSI